MMAKDRDGFCSSCSNAGGRVIAISDKLVRGASVVMNGLIQCPF